jgi:hypothetical protein
MRGAHQRQLVIVVREQRPIPHQVPERTRRVAPRLCLITHSSATMAQ